MSSISFVAGTTIPSTWLNDVNVLTYNVANAVPVGTLLNVTSTSSTGGSLRTLQAKLNELPSSSDYSARGTDNYGYGSGVLASLAPAGAGTAVDSIAIGKSALAAMTTGFANTAIGKNAAKSLTENGYTTAIGAYALENANLVGNVNLLCTAVGAYALNSNTIGQYNTAVGAYAGQLNTTGNFNTYIGQNSGVTNTTGVSNVGVGHSALQLNVGSRNVAVGDNALPVATGADDTIAIGYQALAANLTSDRSIGIGTNALATATAGPNLAIGYLTGQSFATGVNNVLIGATGCFTNAIFAPNRNTALGVNTLNGVTQGSDCTALGYNALNVSVTSDNTAVGSGTLTLQTSGATNTAIGKSAGASVTTGSNNILLGASAGTDAVATVSTASNQLVAGNNSITNAFVKVAWTVTSDARDKTDVSGIARGLQFVMQLQPKKFKLMDRATGEATTGYRYGFLAQDVMALDQGASTLVDAHDPENLKMNENMMIPILVKAIQELQAEVAELRKQVK